MTKTITSPSGKILHLVTTRQTTMESDTSVKVIKVNRQKLRRDENQEYLKNPNVKAFLDMTGKSEGGDYHALFGWFPGNKEWVFTDESTHPGAGKGGKTTASGLYQINKACWTEHGIKTQGLSDFSPHTQDLIAIDNIRTHNSLQPIMNGNIKVAIDALKENQWTSFNAHPYNALLEWYKAAGGSVSN